MSDAHTLVQPVAEDAAEVAVLDLAIIILNYNTVHLLRACVDSVLMADTGLRYDVCVVDNASTDGSAAMIRREFPGVRLIANSTNIGYSAGNNVGMRAFGLGKAASRQNRTDHHTEDPTEDPTADLPRYVLLLNPDTVVPPTALEAMVRFMDESPTVGVAGPRVRRPDGTLDRACRRSFPTPQVSFYRMTGLSRLFPKSRRFNAYNMAYWPEDAVHPVDAVVGAFMLVRGEAIEQVGLLDEAFFMYGEDLDWAKRIKDAGWAVWYNGKVEITHVKEASSRQSSKARIDFYEAMWLFYRKHYRQDTSGWLDRFVSTGIALRGGLDVARHLWSFCRDGSDLGERGKRQKGHA